ncbi:hypothetical protein BD309DRAFT_507478 [Dichomitus squalens]|nr:hypothetical protein BD309DRAFT_507478 [Dichomitus squalens]
MAHTSIIALEVAQRLIVRKICQCRFSLRCSRPNGFCCKSLRGSLTGSSRIHCICSLMQYASTGRSVSTSKPRTEHLRPINGDRADGPLNCPRNLLLSVDS